MSSETDAVLVWGTGRDGQLGLGLTTTVSSTPSLIVKHKARVQAMDCGYRHSVMVRDNILAIFARSHHDSRHFVNSFALLMCGDPDGTFPLSAQQVLQDGQAVLSCGTGQYGRNGTGTEQTLFYPTPVCQSPYTWTKVALAWCDACTFREG
eukprot:834327-Prorocentrum_minimum.AAC.3